jgi:zona occludens toxin
MIEMLEGVPGSGKSYYAVSERLLKWVRAGRRVYVYVDGFYLDRLALFEGVELAVLEQQITIWNSGEDVKAGLLHVEPGSAVLIDEVQTIFRSRDKTDPELLRWLETHRHRGIDLVLMCQQYGQVTLGVNRLVEATTKFRRLDRFGLKNRYQASVRSNPEELEVIRMFTGKYEPELYAYYSSYSSAAIRESARGGSILKSPMVMLGLLGLVASVWFFSSGKWLSAELLKAQATFVVPPPSLPPAKKVEAMLSAVDAAPVVVPVRIQGGMTVERDGKEVWLWVAQDGRLLTEDEIAAESGGSVRSRMVRGVRELSGTGVQYGGLPSERLAEVKPILPYVPPENPNRGPMPEVYTGPHPGLLATPPDLR